MTDPFVQGPTPSPLPLFLASWIKVITVGVIYATTIVTFPKIQPTLTQMGGGA